MAAILCIGFSLMCIRGDIKVYCFELIGLIEKGTLK